MSTATEPITCLHCNRIVVHTARGWEHDEEGSAACYDRWPVRMGFVKDTQAEPDLNDEARAEAERTIHVPGATGDPETCEHAWDGHPTDPQCANLCGAEWEGP